MSTHVVLLQNNIDNTGNIMSDTKDKVKKPSSQGGPNDANSIEILETSIQELQRKYDQVNSVHDQLRVRVLALLTVVAGIATYIFTDVDFFNMSSADKFLFAIGSLLLITVFGVLLRIVSSSVWEMPVELKEIERASSIYKNRLAYLEYIQCDYLIAIRNNIARTDTSGKLFNRSIYGLVASAIILLALKGAN